MTHYQQHMIALIANVWFYRLRSQSDEIAGKRYKTWVKRGKRIEELLFEVKKMTQNYVRLEDNVYYYKAWNEGDDVKNMKIFSEDENHNHLHITQRELSYLEGKDDSGYKFRVEKVDAETVKVIDSETNAEHVYVIKDK